MALCSTPHGVVAVCTLDVLEFDTLEQFCAQRLTASLLSAPEKPLYWFFLGTVLNASRRRCCLHPLKNSKLFWGPEVLNASRRRCCLHVGGGAREAGGRLVLNASRRRCCLHTRRGGTGRRRRRVLNASRRRCCLHLVGTPGADGRLLCSTPHGVVAVCTIEHVGERDEDRVLNASRRRCCLHRVEGPRHPRGHEVLNASRRRCCLHSITPGRVCWRRSGAQRLTASLLSAPRSIPTAPRVCTSAQRLTASLLSARWTRCRPPGACRRVLNASRRRCCLHPAWGRSWHRHPSCVLNASRRRCCLHAPTTRARSAGG